MSYGFGDGLYDEAVGPRPHRLRVMSGVLVTAGRDSRSTAEKMLDQAAERLASSTQTKLVECWCGSALRDVPADAAAAKFTCSSRCTAQARRTAPPTRAVASGPVTITAIEYLRNRWR